MSGVIIALLTLAAMSLGLRMTSLLFGADVHPMMRLTVSLASGGLISLVALEVCDSYRVFELGLGLLLSLSPVGLFDLVKWWYQWRNQPRRG
jgi:hypothetical protein